MKRSLLLLVLILFLLPSAVGARNGKYLIDEPPNVGVEFINLSGDTPVNVSGSVISSSGNRVVYVVNSSNGASVIVVDSNGLGKTVLFEDGKLTVPGKTDIHLRLQSTCVPMISGDGNTIAFSVEELPFEFLGRFLLIYNFNGVEWKGPIFVDFKGLSKTDYDYDVNSIGTPSISYDGKVIITAVSFKYFDIWDSCIAKTDKNGAGPFSILHFDSFKYTLGGDPVLNDNGDKVIFCGRRDDDYESPYVLYMMNSDGSNLRNISPSGTILGSYGGGDYQISSDGSVVGLTCVDINNPQNAEYKIINTLDGSEITTITNYEGDSVYSVNFGRPQITVDGKKVFYLWSNGYLEIHNVYSKDIYTGKDLTLLNDKTENLLWEYRFVHVGGGKSSSNIGTVRYMDKSGEKFLIAKAADSLLTEVNLYLVKIKGEEKPEVSSDFKLQWTDKDEGYNIDLKDCYIAYDENTISFKITSYRKWGDWTKDFWIGIFFNTDKDTSTGWPISQGANGEDLVAVIGNDGGVLSYFIYQWIDNGWKKFGELEDYKIENNSNETIITMSRSYFKEDFEYWVKINDYINNEADYYPNDDQDYYAYFKFETTTPSPPTTTSPSNLKAYPGDNKVYLEWNSPEDTSNIVGYYLYRAKNSGGYTNTPVTDFPVEDTHYIDPNVENGITYYYICKAVYKDGTESPPSNEVKVAPKKPKPIINLPDVTTTKDDKITFSGNVGVGSNLTVNGIPIKVDDNGFFTVTIPLKEGENIIKIIIKNKTEDIITIIKKVIREVEKKEIVIVLRIGDPTAYINNVPYTLDVPPFIDRGRTLVPFRFVGEALGATVGYTTDPITGKVVTVTYKLADTFIVLYIGKKYADVNNSRMELDVPPQIVKGRTVVPLRFVTEALGCDVKWDGITKTVTIIYGTKGGSKEDTPFDEITKYNYILVGLFLAQTKFFVDCCIYDEKEGVYKPYKGTEMHGDAEFCILWSGEVEGKWDGLTYKLKRQTFELYGTTRYTTECTLTITVDKNSQTFNLSINSELYLTTFTGQYSGNYEKWTSIVSLTSIPLKYLRKGKDTDRKVLLLNISEKDYSSLINCKGDITLVIERGGPSFGCKSISTLTEYSGVIEILIEVSENPIPLSPK